MQITIERGRDIAPWAPSLYKFAPDPIVGAAALVGSDYPGVRPSFLVDVGDQVATGETLFVDSKRPEIAFCAPISGMVAEVRRGPRRTLDIIRIVADGERVREFRSPEPSDSGGVRRLLLESGMWPAFRTRPFERIPNPGDKPAAIFVTAMDTEPLASNPSDLLRREEGSFRTGLEVVRALTIGPVFVCQKPGPPVVSAMDNIQIVEFAGPHPAGLPGTHIHHLMPVSRTRQVWHIGCQDVLAIGRLFETGKFSADRIISLAGPAVDEPCLMCTKIGADLYDLVVERCVTRDSHIVSGSVLSGRSARFLGRYHTQVSVLVRDQNIFGDGLFSRIAMMLGGNSIGAIIPTSAYEAVMPLNIPAVPLLRALSVGDSENAERLGCLELAESDLALLSHVCTSNADYAPLLRNLLDEIEEWI